MNLKQEFPTLLATAAGLNKDADRFQWWKNHPNDLPYWFADAKKIIHVQSSSAAAERGFSLLQNSLTHEEERERTSSTDDEEETMRENESENERELSSSESEGDFDTDDAQHCFDDFVISLPSLARKTLSVSLMHYFQQCQGMNVKQSAQEAAYITGYNEKTIREYRLDFLANRGRFSDFKRGKYERFYLFNDENIHLEQWCQTLARGPYLARSVIIFGPRGNTK